MKKKEAKYPIPIREWSVDDRPREKLLKYGEHALSNAELLAIMIRTGAPGKSAVDIGRELLHKFKSLRAMSGVDISEFKKITGLKNAKIAQIKAAIELGRRMLSEEKALEGPVKSSSDVVGFLMPLMGTLNKERFCCCYLIRETPYQRSWILSMARLITPIPTFAILSNWQFATMLPRSSSPTTIPRVR